ncbi:MAG: lactococcin 972 family bacteriocin [Lactovum sp.]
MKNIKKVLISLAVVMALATGGVTALAYTSYVGGGTWNYGNYVGYAYSDYYHGSKDHSSTVIVGNRSNRDLAGRGDWSQAGLWTKSGASYYYNYW